MLTNVLLYSPLFIHFVFPDIIPSKCIHIIVWKKDISIAITHILTIENSTHKYCNKLIFLPIFSKFILYETEDKDYILWWAASRTVRCSPYTFKHNDLSCFFGRADFKISWQHLYILLSSILSSIVILHIVIWFKLL